MSSDSMRSSSDAESEEEQERNSYTPPRRALQLFRSNVRGRNFTEPVYRRLSAKSDEERVKTFLILIRDSRAETFLMLARLLYLHKLIYEEEAEDQRSNMLKKLEDLQKIAKVDYKCRRISWISTLSEPVGDARGDQLNEKIRERIFHIWRQLDIAVIDLTIYMCAEQAQVFLHALCLKVRGPTLRRSQRMWQLETKWEAGFLVPARVEHWQVVGKWDTSQGLTTPSSGLKAIAPRDRLEEEDEDDEEEQDDDDDEEEQEPGRCSSWCDSLSGGYGSRKIESELYFTLCSELISGNREDQYRFDHLHFLQSMLRCPAALFATPLGYASIQRCWCHGAWPFVGLRLVDALYLLALCIFIVPVAHKSHSQDPVWPNKHEVLIIAALSARSGLFLVMEFIMALTVAAQFQRRFPEEVPTSVTRSVAVTYFRTTFLNPFTALCSGVEIWSLVFTCFLVHDCWMADGSSAWGEDEEEVDMTTFIQRTILYKRPVMLCCLLLAKWAQLMLQLLALQSLLEPLLPAWHALKSQNSLTVLGGFIVLCIGTANGYYALPVTGGHAEGFLGALFIMFRLDLMGDFDEAELMAGTQHQAPPPKGHLGASRVDEMYFALKGFTILCALVFTVSLLNVYVGILSAKYDEARSNLLDGMGRFRAVPAFRIHLCSQLLRCVRFFGYPEEARDDDEGFWILLPKRHLPDHLDTENAHPSLRWEGWVKK